MTTLLPVRPRLSVESVNRHHPGVEFGVVHLATSDIELPVDACLDLLAEEGWTHPMRVSCARPGVKKFVLARKK